MEIWIVDDAFFMRKMLKNIIVEHTGYVPRELEDGQEFIDTYTEFVKKGFSVDLVFLDLTMPVMDGRTALKKANQIKPTNFVICSNLSSQHVIIDCVKNGAVGFVSKPFEENQITNTLDKFTPRIEFNKKGYVIDVTINKIFALLKQKKYDVVEKELKAGFDINSTYNGKDIIDYLTFSHCSDVYDWVLHYESLFNANLQRKLGGIKLRHLFNNGLSKT